jgi:hypothetical protein
MGTPPSCEVIVISDTVKDSLPECQASPGPAEDSAATASGVEAYSLMWDYLRDGTRLVTWFECVPEPLA